MNELLKRRSVALLLSAALVAVPVSSMAGSADTDSGGAVGDGSSVDTDSSSGGGDTPLNGGPTYNSGDVDMGGDSGTPRQPCTPDPCSNDR